MAGIGNSGGAFCLPLPQLKEIGFRQDGVFLVFSSQWKVDGVPVYAVIKPERTDREIVSFDFVSINAGHFPNRRLQFSLVYRINCDAGLTLVDGVLQNLRPEYRSQIELLTSFLTDSFRSRKGIRNAPATSSAAATSGRR